jgi:DivIVA domain-containing protein
MIELTPLDVRKKKGDFRRGLRGYEPQQVDDFLDIVADRLDAVVRDAVSMHERVSRLEQQVSDYRDREKALTEALVTAQQMREDMRTQSTREVELIRKQAEQEAESIKSSAVAAREREEDSLRQLRIRQVQFLSSYRTFLEHELADLQSMSRALEVYGSGVAGPPQRAAAPSPAGAPPSGGHGGDAGRGRSGSEPSGASASPASSAGLASEAPAYAPAPTSPARPAERSPWESDSRVASTPPPARPMPPSAAPKAAVSPAPPAKSSGPMAGASSPAGRRGSEELEAQLEKALARWEPELEESEPASAHVDEPDDEDEDEVDSLESESPEALADELELLLSDDDMVGGAAPAAPAEPAAGTKAVAGAPSSRGVPRTLEDSDDLEAELAELLAAEDDEEDFDLELEDGPVAEVATAAHQLTAEEIRTEVTTAMSDSGTESMIDLDDAFGEPPATADDVEREPTFDDLLKAATLPATEDEPGPEAPAEDPYGLSAFDPRRTGGGDAETSGLTLHPMFFDQDSPDLPGLLHPSEEKRKEDRHDRWSSSGEQG